MIKRKRKFNLQKEELISLLDTMSLTDISKKLQVSDAAINYWCKKYNIKRKERSYWRNFNRIKNETIPNQIEIEILNGLMLGDGSLTLYKNKGAKNAYLTIEHSIAQKNYCEWFSKKLNFLNSKMCFRKAYKNKINNRIIYGKGSWRLITQRHSFLTNLFNQWYSLNNKKEVPEDIKLTWQTIAIWYFDDGNLNIKTKCITLYTNSFSEKSINILINQLKFLGIDDCNVKWQNKKYPLIVIQRKSIKFFIESIIPYLNPNELMYKELFYKIDLSEYIESKRKILNKEDKIKIKTLKNQGKNIKEISKITKFGETTIRRILKSDFT